MKRFVCMLLALVLLLSLAGCGKEKNLDYFSSEEELTVSALLERTLPQTMLSYAGAFQAEYRYEGAENSNTNDYSKTLCFVYDGDYIQANQFLNYDDGQYQRMYFSTNPVENAMYIETKDGPNRVELVDRELQNILDQSLFSMEQYDCEIADYQQSGGTAAFTLYCTQNEMPIQDVEIRMDTKAGVVTDAVCHYYNGGQLFAVCSIKMSYGAGLTVDTSPKDNYIAKYGAPAEAPAGPAPEKEGSSLSEKTGPFTFATKDLAGDSVTYADFVDAKLIMVNYFEADNQTCLETLPDMEKLYQKYREQGFVLLGVFSQEGSEAAVQAAVEEAGLSYPVLYCDTRLQTYRTDYVPSSILVDETGTLITDEPYIGSYDYADWEILIQDCLNGEYPTETEE